MNSKARVFSSWQRRFASMVLMTFVMVPLSRADGPPTEEDIKQITWIEREFLLSPPKFLFDSYAQLANGDGTVNGDEYHFGRGGDHDGFLVYEFVAASADSNGSSARRKSALISRGLIQMIVPDSAGVDQRYYDWAYKGQELLGDIRCWIFDLRPLNDAGYGAFIGRIWVAIQDLAIVRFDGTYTSNPKKASPYVHFVSVRTKNPLGQWLPSEIYIEEKNLAKPIKGSTKLLARVSIWGYRPDVHSTSESTAIRIPAAQNLVVTNDSPNSRDPEERYHEIENDVLGWMEADGLLATVGNTEKVLETVVSNIIATNGISYRWPIRCRVLLTTPLESFTIGNTIVLSKGLIDVVADEPGLALLLARELAHILLKHHIDTKFGFHDFFMRDEEQVLKTLNFQRTSKEVDDADLEAIQLFVKSPYKQKLSSAALFLQEVHQSCEQMPALFQPQFGNRLPGCGRLTAMNRLLELAPQSSKELSALPLRTRVIVDAWTDATYIVEPPRTVAPFQLIPVMLNPKATGEVQTEDPVVPPDPKPHLPAWPVRR
jgi:hypothetical protein